MTALHPSWCDRLHGDEQTAHSVQIGVDLDLTKGLSMWVELSQVADKPTVVTLYEHTGELTTVTEFSIVQGTILRDLFSEALSTIAAEVAG